MNSMNSLQITLTVPLKLKKNVLPCSLVEGEGKTETKWNEEHQHDLEVGSQNQWHTEISINQSIINESMNQWINK